WVLDWYKVKDATSYVVSVENGGTYETEETQLDMQFLSPGETYTISVYAKGGTDEHGTTFLDSEKSALTLTMPEVSEDLEYRLIEDGTAYEVIGPKDFNGAGVIVLPDYYEGKPVVSVWGFGRMNEEERADITGVRLPRGLKIVAPNAFGDTNIEKVVLPSTLETIGNSAFRKTQLQEIIIPQNVMSIGEEAFKNCTSLTDVTILSAAPDLGMNIFENTAWYKAQPDGYIYLGKTLYRHKGDFAKNTHLDLGELSTRNIKITSGAFSGCKGITSVEIPGDIVLGECTFQDCVDLAEVHFSDGITEIMERTFSGCSKLSKIEFPSTLEKIGKYAFKGAKLEVVILPSTVTEIVQFAFSGCTLTGLVIPDGIALFEDPGIEVLEWVCVPLPSENMNGYNSYFGMGLSKAYVKATREELLAMIEEDVMFKHFCKGPFGGTTAYAYSEEPPTEAGDFWHYDTDGVTPIPWEN
ncbi:MAG: leucine-rich repeat domain-containing protein, partial [Clostridia bacterium]|nr:leucine-rich repeat domain-containing protein [Clostridia bacterium]